MIRISTIPRYLQRVSGSLVAWQRQLGIHVRSQLAFCSSKADLQEPVQDGVKSYEELPGPGMFENISTLIRKGGMKNLYEIQCEKFQKYGPIFKEELMGEKVVHVADAEAHEAIAHSEETFPSRGFNQIFGLLDDTSMYAFFGNDYERWKAARSPIAPSFLRPVEIQKFASGVNSVASDAVKRLRRELNNGKIVQLKHELDGYTTENILLLTFGERMGFYDDPQNPKILEFMQIAYDLNAALNSLITGPPLWKYISTPGYRKLVGAKKNLFTLSTEFGKMRTAKSKQAGDTFLYDKITDKDNKTDIINGLAIALSQVGVETTSTSLLWCLYYLSQNPEVQEKAYQKTVSVIGTATNDKSSENPQFHSKLPYIRACVKETMRFIQIAVLHARVMEKDTIICGYNIPAKMTVCLWPWCLAYSPEHFNKPEIFEPQRWIRGEGQEKVNPFAHIPFGFGVRMCLGRRFAEMELAIGLAHILQNFRLEYVGNESIKPILKQGLAYPNKEPPIKLIERV